MQMLSDYQRLLAHADNMFAKGKIDVQTLLKNAVIDVKCVDTSKRKKPLAWDAEFYKFSEELVVAWNTLRCTRVFR